MRILIECCRKPEEKRLNSKICLSTRGFTLIEMLITVVMVSILAAIALPGYQDSIRSARRGEAKVQLMLLAKAQIKWRGTDTDYANTDELDTFDPQNGIKHIMRLDDKNVKDYDYAVTENTATKFTITATPTGEQTNDSCGTLSIVQDPDNNKELGFSCSSGIEP